MIWRGLQAKKKQGLTRRARRHGGHGECEITEIGAASGGFCILRDMGRGYGGNRRLGTRYKIKKKRHLFTPGANRRVRGRAAPARSGGGTTAWRLDWRRGR